jgi:hypothetical protein
MRTLHPRRLLDPKIKIEYRHVFPNRGYYSINRIGEGITGSTAHRRF